MSMVISGVPGVVTGMLGRIEVGRVEERLVIMLVGNVESKLIGGRVVGKLVRGTMRVSPSASVMTMGVGTDGIVGATGRLSLGTRPAEGAELRMETKEKVMANETAEGLGLQDL